MTNHEQERIQQYERAIYSTAYDASTVEDVIDLADAEITAMARKGARRIIEARKDTALLNSMYHATAAKNIRLANEVKHLDAAWRRADEDANDVGTENAKLRAGLKALAEHKGREEPDNAVVEAFRILEDEQTELRDTLRAVHKALMQGGQTDRIRWQNALRAMEVPR